MTELDSLFAPIRIGRLDVINRIVMSAHGTRLWRDGLPSEEQISYYEQRARGGVGLIVVTTYPVYPQRDEGGHLPTLWSQRPDSDALHREMIERVTKHGTRLLAQIGYGGRQVSGAAVLRAVQAPSGVPWDLGGEMPRAMTTREVKSMVQSFGTAAARVKELGFEGVEIHGGHGYLIHEFLSAASNKRTDDYGGSFDNRLRFLLEVVESVRSSVGPDFTVGFRLSGDEFVDGGTSLEHQAAVAGRVASLGLADYVSQTAGAYRSMERIVLPPTFGQGAHLHLSRAIKEAVGSLPLMVVGRIFEPEYANQIVRDGVGDMVVMTRALIADPQLPKKARESHSGRVRHCVGAMECWARTRKDFPVSCSVNPRAGRESQKLLEKTAYPSTIAVVGAGPGGAEVAIRLGATGHRVVLFDKASETGGRLNLASRASILAQWGRLVDDQRDDLAHSKNVQLALGTEASVDSLRDLGPAAIVVAAGARPRCPEVMDSGGTLNVDEALANPSGVGCRVLVYCETRHMAPLAVAHALANSDRSVTIVSPHAQVGAALDPNSYADVRRRLAVAKVSILPELLLHHVDGDAAYFNEVWPNWPAEQGVPTREIAFDTLIYDVGDMPYDDLYFKLSAAGFLAFRVGDCLTPRNVIGATRDASDLPLVLEGRLARQSTS